MPRSPSAHAVSCCPVSFRTARVQNNRAHTERTDNSGIPLRPLSFRCKTGLVCCGWRQSRYAPTGKQRSKDGYREAAEGSWTMLPPWRAAMSVRSASCSPVTPPPRWQRRPDLAVPALGTSGTLRGRLGFCRSLRQAARYFGLRPRRERTTLLPRSPPWGLGALLGGGSLTACVAGRRADASVQRHRNVACRTFADNRPSTPMGGDSCEARIAALLGRGLGGGPRSAVYLPRLSLWFTTQKQSRLGRKRRTRASRAAMCLCRTE